MACKVEEWQTNLTYQEPHKLEYQDDPMEGIEYNNTDQIYTFDTTKANNIIGSMFNPMFTQTSLLCHQPKIVSNNEMQNIVDINSYSMQFNNLSRSLNSFFIPNITNFKSSLFRRSKNKSVTKLEIKIDLANLIGDDFDNIRYGQYIDSTKLQKIFNHLAKYEEIQVQKITFCTKHTNSMLSDKYYTCLRNWLNELEPEWKIKEFNVPISVNVYKYTGLKQKIIINGKDIENESDDTGLIDLKSDAHISDVTTLIITRDFLRSLSDNIIALQRHNVRLSMTNHDPYEEPHIRKNALDNTKMDIDPNEITLQNLKIPNTIKALDPQNLEFRMLYPWNKTKFFEIVCIHRIINKSCFCGKRSSR